VPYGLHKRFRIEGRIITVCGIAERMLYQPSIKCDSDIKEKLKQQ
jgi:hypothetical protein